MNEAVTLQPGTRAASVFGPPASSCCRMDGRRWSYLRNLQVCRRRPPTQPLPPIALFRPQGQGASHGTTYTPATSATSRTQARPAPPKPTTAAAIVSATGGRRAVVSTRTPASVQVGCTQGGAVRPWRALRVAPPNRLPLHLTPPSVGLPWRTGGGVHPPCGQLAGEGPIGNFCKKARREAPWCPVLGWGGTEWA